MSQHPLADGVRFERVRTPGEVKAFLIPLPDGARTDFACELDERGQALHLDGVNQRVYHARREGDAFVVVTWGPMSTLFEAAILLSSIKTLGKPVDEESAVQLYLRASFRAELLIEPRRQPSATASEPGSVERLRSALIALQAAYGSLRLMARAYSARRLSMTRP